MHVCLADKSQQEGLRRNCRPCKAAYSRKYRAQGKYQDKKNWERVKRSNMAHAKSLVFIAVRKGELPPVNMFSCVLCGTKASCYDHRDYDKPLEVQPVCGSCNKKLGPGENR